MSSTLNPSRPTGPARSPLSSRRWWVVAALVAVTGLVAGAAWAAVSFLALTQRPEAFTRALLPGSVAVDLEAGERAVAYVEAPSPDTAQSAEVTVRGPDGHTVATRRYSRLLQYDVTGAPGRRGSAVQSFQAPAAGRYTVAGAAPTADPAPILAVGADLADGAVRALLAPSLLALGMLVLAGVLVATPIVRSRPGDRTNGPAPRRSRRTTTGR